MLHVTLNVKKGIYGNRDKDKRDKRGILNGGRIVILFSNNFVDHKKNAPLQTFSTKHVCCVQEVFDIHWFNSVNLILRQLSHPCITVVDLLS